MRIEELPTNVCKAASSNAPAWQGHAVVALVRIGDEFPGGAFQHAFGGLARAARREDVSDHLSLVLVLRDEAPEPRATRLPLRLHAVRRLVREDDLLFRDHIEEPIRDRLRDLGGPVEVVAERRVIHLHADAPVCLGLAVQWQGVGALRDRDLRHEGRADARLIEDLGRTVCGDDGLAALAAQLLLNVPLPLDDGGYEQSCPPHFGQTF